MRAPVVPHLPSRGLQTQCSFSGPFGRQSQTFACRDVSRCRQGTIAYVSEAFNQKYPTDLLETLDMEMARMQRSLVEAENQMTAEFREIDKRADKTQHGSMRFMNPDGMHTYRKEQQFEQRTGSGYLRGHRLETITYYGQPLAPGHMHLGTQPGSASMVILALVFLTGAYLAVTSRLAAVWDKTRYSAADAARVIPLWPYLAVFSTDFRREIKTALFGHSARPNNEGGRRT